MGEFKLDYCNINILINCRFNEITKKKINIPEGQTPERYFQSGRLGHNYAH